MGRMGYCSACDRNVPVVLRGSVAGGTPSPRDAEALVCLDYGVRCTGALCPLFSVEPPPAPTSAPRSTIHGEGPRPSMPS
ncbi:MAG: hypothetical protein RLN75_06270 [Longimicrobiales bacterium]